jgi:hypothetical protein
MKWLKMDLSASTTCDHETFTHVVTPYPWPLNALVRLIGGPWHARYSRHLGHFGPDVNLFILDRLTVTHNSKSTRASGLLQVTHELMDYFLSKLIRIFTVV